MTPEQLEDLEYLINDPDWDVSQRNDAWELLKVMRSELAALAQGGATADMREALEEVQLQIERMAQSAVGIGDENVEAYQIKTGAFHALLGMVRGGKVSMALTAQSHAPGESAVERATKLAKVLCEYGWIDDEDWESPTLIHFLAKTLDPAPQAGAGQALANALRILLASHDCLAPDGGAEIPEELSARFDIGLDDARQVVAALQHTDHASGAGQAVIDAADNFILNWDANDCDIAIPEVRNSIHALRAALAAQE